VWLDLDRGTEISVAGFTGDKDEPGVFVTWLKKQGADVCAGDFPTARTVQEIGKPPTDAGAQFAEHGLGTWADLGLLAMPVKAELWDSPDAKAILAMNPAFAAQADSDKVRTLIPDGQTPENPRASYPRHSSSRRRGQHGADASP